MSADGQKLNKLIKRHYKVFIFPLVLTLLLLSLTLLKIHGSSIGRYHEMFYGESIKDESLLLNNPRGVRSDEWLRWTQYTVSQDKNNFESSNEFFSNGIDITKLHEAPAKSWSDIFKPSNFSFFVLLFEHAFAFKLWFLIYAVILLE